MEVNRLYPVDEARFIRMLRKTVQEYFQDKKHQDEFQKWHLKTYGEPYTFKYVSNCL